MSVKMKLCSSCFNEIPDDYLYCPHCGHDASLKPRLHHLLPGTVLGQRYAVGAVLGEGGFGITYIGKDNRLNVRVAIKEFYPNGYVNRTASVSSEVSCVQSSDDRDFFKKGRLRFLNEAQALARFSGAPGIVGVRDFFEENNTAYIVMDYLEGETLKSRVKQAGRLSFQDTAELLMPVLSVLRLLHEEGLIHRDVSPDNIMLTENGVQLLDFGAARLYTGEEKSLSVLFKPGFAPLEQYTEKGAQGPWTDIYAFCATVYYCITGIRPDAAPDRMENDMLQPPSVLGVHISPREEAALMKGLSLKGADRFQTVDALLAALDMTGETQPETADPPEAARQALFPDLLETLAVPASVRKKTYMSQAPDSEPPLPAAQPPVQAADSKKKSSNKTGIIVISLLAVCVLLISIVVCTYFLSKETLQVENVKFEYTQAAYRNKQYNPAVTVMNKAGDQLAESKDYTLEVPEGRKVPGIYEYTVTGKGKYKGKIKCSLRIIPCTLKEENVKLYSAAVIYNGKQRTPVVTVTSPWGVKLTEGTHYLVEVPSGRTSPGAYVYKIRGTGDRFTGTVEKVFTIYAEPEQLQADNITLYADTVHYNGKLRSPVVTVLNSKGEKLKNGRDYAVIIPEGRTQPGAYVYIIVGMGLYTGSVEKTFTILPAR